MVTDMQMKDLSGEITRREALQILSALEMIIAKNRSIQLEGLGYVEQSWHDLSDLEREMISFMSPGLFGEKPNILETIIKTKDMGENLQPINLHNILYYIGRDAYLSGIISMWNPTLLSDDFPRWTAGWTSEENQNGAS